MTKKSSEHNKPIPQDIGAPDVSWLEELALVGEEPPSEEELAAAQQFASLTDSWIHETNPDEAPSLHEEWEELASLGLLMRHAASPPSLLEESKLRIEAEILSEPMSVELSQPGWWERVQAGWQGLFLRPVWTAFAVAFLCVGSWGVYQSVQSPQQTSTPYSRYYTQALPGQRLFGGTMSKPSQLNPFQNTRSASERLGAVTEKLSEWQRKRWLHQTRSFRTKKEI